MSDQHKLSKQNLCVVYYILLIGRRLILQLMLKKHHKFNNSGPICIKLELIVKDGKSSHQYLFIITRYTCSLIYVFQFSLWSFVKLMRGYSLIWHYSVGPHQCSQFVKAVHVVPYMYSCVSDLRKMMMIESLFEIDRGTYCWWSSWEYHPVNIFDLVKEIARFRPHQFYQFV